MCIGVCHGIWLRDTERGEERLGSFFGAAKNKRSRVHRKRVARIKHRGRRGCNNDRGERKREIERERNTLHKTEKDRWKKSSRR
jgi:hypothetical protein